MKEQHLSHPGKAQKHGVGVHGGWTGWGPGGGSSWTLYQPATSIKNGRSCSLQNIARAPLSPNDGEEKNNFKRNYSLRIVRKLSRLLNSSSGGAPSESYLSQHYNSHDLVSPLQGFQEQQFHYPGPGPVLQQSVEPVHLPKRCSPEDGGRRVVSRRQILSSLREEEETDTSQDKYCGGGRMHHTLHNNIQNRTKNQQHHKQDADAYQHNIRETRSLERFIPEIRYEDCSYDDADDLSQGYLIARSRPRTIYSHNLLDSSSQYSRFSLSFNKHTDPLLAHPCTGWQNRRRTKSISGSPEWSSAISEQMSDTNLSSLSLTSSAGGKRFSRCLLLQSISKEEMRDPSDCESGCDDVPEPMSPGSPCSQQSSTSEVDSTSVFEDVTTSDEEVESKSALEDDNANNRDSYSKMKAVNNTINNDTQCDNKQESYDNQNFHSTTASVTTGGSGEVEESGVSVDVDNIQLTSLNWVGTLGIGGFGRVELVTAGLNNNQTYALKKMKKAEITEEKHQQHILNEKSIMASCSSPFIVKLYRTFRDSRYLYMLMEPCLGGELWTILRDKKKFEDSAAKFYTACVIKAFEYLHSKGIVYRDLKPENLLLDSSGYVKLTDFGFSKQLESGEKSWTFCGTPEYVAPEMITNKTGHDQRADIWGVGILMYELLCGIPPFSKTRNNEGGKNNVYTEILKGMKSVYFPQHMSSTAVELIRQLCRLNPAQRPSLAITRKFMWFASMDWEGLENRTLSPPFLPKIQGSRDTSNFDNYSKDSEQPKEDFADWDIDF